MSTIDLATLPRHFESVARERYWSEVWDRDRVYASAGPADGSGFTVDTPPPTVSGSLHIGHAFSYAHADMIVRYQRMRGRRIQYPIGWDDNGLPTERRVQYYFNVTCDIDAPYDPLFDIGQAPAPRNDTSRRRISRRNFIELCNRLTVEDEQVYKRLWRRLGLSVDWSSEYTTIGDSARRLAQLSFIDLHRKGHVYNRAAPVMWDTEFGTAIAQAEVEDRFEKSRYHHIRFLTATSREQFTVATTRPELLPACVGVAVNPSDNRYRHLIGTQAITPLFGVPVPIFPSAEADPDKGTGILMVCTFGDAQDVIWWEEQHLPLRQIIGADGRLEDVRFGGDGFESLWPEEANARYRSLAGTSVQSARREIVQLLLSVSPCFPGGSDEMRGSDGKTTDTKHFVRYYEKGSRPLELISARQWFVRLLDKKDQLLEYGDRIQWHPDYMRARYADWTRNLKYDWCISRQRFFGVPFPVWYRLDHAGLPDHEHPILPTEDGALGLDALPIDPVIDAPPGFHESQRGEPGGFAAETDVFDTWFTSSLSPQIISQVDNLAALHDAPLPMSMRPQSHEIIRTWTFYTIAKAMLHQSSIPWKNVVISGWVVDPDRKKMSKSRGNVVTPEEHFDRFTVDGVRYWAACAALGTDTAFDEQKLKVGRRLVTKIYNASKFVLSKRYCSGHMREEIDLDLIERLRTTAQRSGEHFERFDFSRALEVTEEFFWRWFTDSYIELVKGRAGDEADASGRDSAVSTLRFVLNVLLRLFAPFLPYICEEVWSWAFAEESGSETIHRAAWPSNDEFAHFTRTRSGTCLESASAALTAIHAMKTQHQKSMRAPLASVAIVAREADITALQPGLADLRRAARAERIEFAACGECSPGEFRAEKPIFDEET